MTGVIISWGKFIRRSKTISQILSFNDLQIQPIFQNKYLKGVNYIRALLLTSAYIAKRRNELGIVVLVLPPNFMLYVMLIRFLFPKIEFIADGHNGAFSGKWLNLTPGVRYLMKQCKSVLVHNDDFLQEINLNPKLKGVKLQVIPDPPSIPINTKKIVDKECYFVFPASYADDEPINELIGILESEEFRKLRIKVYLTGPCYKLSDSQIKKISNLQSVHLTGFLSIDEYESLLLRAMGVLCLTKKEGIQLCAINEAIGYGSIPVYSNTDTLNRMYKGVGLPVDVNLSNLVEVIKACTIDKKRLLNESINIREQRINEWKVTYSRAFSTEID